MGYRRSTLTESIQTKSFPWPLFVRKRRMRVDNTADNVDITQSYEAMQSSSTTESRDTRPSRMQEVKACAHIRYVSVYLRALRR